MFTFRFTMLQIFLFVLVSCHTFKDKTDELTANYSLTFHDFLEPISSIDKDFSHFGVQYNGMPFHLSVEFDSLDIAHYLENIPVTAQAASELGLKWARVSVDWSSVEDNHGNFHWVLLDEIVDQLVDKKIEIYLCLHGGHRVHTSFRPPVSPAELDAWENFARKVIFRYRDRIDYWEIWNEGNSIWFWANNPNAQEYMELVRRTTAVIDELDPGAKVVGGNTARLDVPYSAELFELGIADYIDVFTFHPYGHFPEAIVRRLQFPVQTPHWYIPTDHQVDDLLALVEKTGKDIQVWQGECGYPSQMNGLGWNGTGPWSEEIQSKWIIRRALVDLSFNSHVSCYFLMKEKTNNSKTNINYKGLLRFEDNGRKPGFYVYQNVIAALDGQMRSDRDHQATFTLTKDGGFPNAHRRDKMTVLLHDQSGKPLFSYWLILRMQDDITLGAAEVRVEGQIFENPLLVDMMTGKRYIISDYEHHADGTTFYNLPVGDYPFIITEL